jgi:hypothetical protein
MDRAGGRDRDHMTSWPRRPAPPQPAAAAPERSAGAAAAGTTTAPDADRPATAATTTADRATRETTVTGTAAGPRGARPGGTALALRLPVINRRNWTALGAWLLAAVLLFVCYLRISRTAPANSDGAANALQAWDMLHGNLLLHGWWLSDVSFYTTELPQYMLVELVHGLNSDVVHVAAAMTYTLLILLVAVLAKGRTTGREAVFRILLAAGIMLTPQLGAGTGILLLSPDHVGSTVPVLLVWLLLERAKPRWYVPVLVAVLLTWALVADSIILITGVLPLLVICAIRAYHGIVGRREPIRAHWHEFSLIAAALAAGEIAARILSLINEAGGFHVWRVISTFAVSAEMPRHFAFTIHGLLVLFGADFFGHHLGLPAGLLVLHLVGLALALLAVCVGVRRFFTEGNDLVSQLALAGVLTSLIAFLVGQRVSDIMSTREFAAVLPFSAVLAGRLLPPMLTRARMVPALALVLAGYLVSFGQAVAAPSVPPMGQPLTTWLTSHHLRYGLGAYWQANIVSLTSSDRVMVVPVSVNDFGVVVHDRWESKASWYDPRLHDADFVVQLHVPPPRTTFLPRSALQAAFGPPAKVYTFGSYTILVWNKNLLTDLQ